MRQARAAGRARRRALFLVLAAGALAAPARVADAGSPPAADGRQVFLREEFLDLHRWRPLAFPRIERHSVYGVEREGEGSVLRAESHASASGIVLDTTFDVRRYPRLSWRWKVSNVYARGDVTTKAGDDYPIRVYALFAYDPARASLGTRLKYAVARLLYGEYPPDSALNYVWSSRPGEEGRHVSPYTDRAVMIVLASGPSRVGQWVPEEVDLLADYRAAFGADPPSAASLAIMNDSDNTGESSVSWLADLQVWGEAPPP